jgi:hypothetical protein
MTQLHSLRVCDDPDSRVAVVAANSILDRAMGKPKDAIPERRGSTKLDLSGLSDDELTQFGRLVAKVTGAPSGTSEEIDNAGAPAHLPDFLPGDAVKPVTTWAGSMSPASERLFSTSHEQLAPNWAFLQSWHSAAPR